MPQTILHLSADFPDSVNSRKTPVVANLISQTQGYRHVVYSLNRTNGFSGIQTVPFSNDGTSLVYGAPPHGVLLSTRLKAVASWIDQDLKKRRIIPDLIHAHKFTIEGQIGYRLALSIGCPLICSVQGNTDTRILRARPDLFPFFSKIARASRYLLSFAPWSADAITKAFPLARCVVLPPVPSLDQLCTSPVCQPKLVSVFHLDNWRNKGLDGIAASVNRIAVDVPGISVDVYGAGASASRVLEMRRHVAKVDRRGIINFKGPVNRLELSTTLRNYAALVMPSIRESYGLVYLEALLSGIPVVFSRQRGIDGLFPENVIGQGCNPLDARDIERAIRHVLKCQEQLKQSIAAAQVSGMFDVARTSSVVQRYQSILEEVSRPHLAIPDHSVSGAFK